MASKFKKPAWLVRATGFDLAVAGIEMSGSVGGTSNSAMAFQIVGFSDITEFADLLCEIETGANLDRFQENSLWKTSQTSWTTGSSNCQVTVSWRDGTVGITVNNCRVLFNGSHHRLTGLGKAIKKAEAKWAKELDDE